MKNYSRLVLLSIDILNLMSMQILTKKKSRRCTFHHTFCKSFERNESERILLNKSLISKYHLLFIITAFASENVNYHRRGETLTILVDLVFRLDSWEEENILLNLLVFLLLASLAVLMMLPPTSVSLMNKSSPGRQLSSVKLPREPLHTNGLSKLMMSIQCKRNQWSVQIII